MNILSIDFDYFLSKEVKQQSDKGNLPLLQYKKWLRDYANNRDFLEVECRTEELGEISRILLNQDPSTPIYIADSHRQIVETVGSDVCTIYNVDHHHDVYYGDHIPYSGYTAANWVYHLHMQEQLKQYVWIKNTESEPYQMKPMDIGFNFASTLDMAILEGKKFDKIFICRSGPWIPPHLLPDFYKFTGILAIHFDDLKWSSEQKLLPIDQPYAYNKSFMEETVWIYNALNKELKK